MSMSDDSLSLGKFFIVMIIKTNLFSLKIISLFFLEEKLFSLFFCEQITYPYWEAARSAAAEGLVVVEGATGGYTLEPVAAARAL